MKTSSKIWLTLITGALTLGTAWAADVSGQWRTEIDTPIGLHKYLYTLKSDGDKLTGKADVEVNDQKREVELKEGKIAGDTVTFVEMLKFQDNEIRIEYKGKLTGNEIKFTRQVGEFANEEFVAKRVKPPPLRLPRVPRTRRRVASEVAEGAADSVAQLCWAPMTSPPSLIRPPGSM